MTEPYESIRARLHHGIFPALPMTCRKNGEIDSTAQDRYIAYMKSQPADGFTIWAHTGRGLLADPAAREYVLRSWRNAFPERLVIAGVGARADLCTKKADPERAFVEESLAMAGHARDLGADAALVFPPVIFRGAPRQDEKILAYHREIARAGLPLIVFFLYEAAGGITYSPDLLRQLLRMPQVAGIKMATLDSVMTYQQVSGMIESEFPDRVLLTGEDRMFGYTVMRGAQAALVGMGAACTALQKHMMEAFYRRDCARFLELSEKVDQLAECTFVPPMEGYIRRMLAVLEMLGVLPHEGAWDPLGPLGEMEPSELRHIEQILKRIGEI